MISAFILCCVACFAQQKERRTVEVELGAGILYSFDKAIFDVTDPGAVLFAEVKYVFPSMPLDIGAQASCQIFRRKSELDLMDYTSSNILLIADYSFYQTPSARAYLGLGAGVGFFEEDRFLERDAPGSFYSRQGAAPFCAMPRIGIQFFRHLDLSLSYLIEDRANQNLSFRIGYVF